MLEGIDKFKFLVDSKFFQDKFRLVEKVEEWNKKYNSDNRLKLVSLEICRRLEYIRNLLCRYYIDKMISGAALEELIMKVLGDNHPVLLAKVLETIEYKYDDPVRAAKLKQKITIVEDLTVVFTYKTGLSPGDIVDVETNLVKATSSKDF